MIISERGRKLGPFIR